MTDRPAADLVRERLDRRRPQVAIVLGSGLDAIAGRIEAPIRFPYSELPGFASVGVAGHRGELVAGRLGGRDVVVQSGRFHLYEGHTPEVAAGPIRLFADLGIRIVILTNAAGGIRRGLGKGELMLIADHANLSFRNPLIGRVLPGEERFPDMSEPYDAELRRRARTAALSAGIPLEEGVYAGVLGPSYETPAEIRMLERLGADAVGMSTVAEVVVARARGLRCLGISVITNAAAGRSRDRLSHDEVLAAAALAQSRLASLVEAVLRELIPST